MNLHFGRVTTFLTMSDLEKGKTALATFGGGCYWCTEAMFQRLRGVVGIVSGFSDGSVVHPTYEAVCAGTTGHAEVVQVEYDPAVISYEQIIKVHMGTHDPTTLNAQGGDVGTQYRSTILWRTEEEKETIGRVLEEMKNVYDQKIVTEVKEFEVFYAAPDYHQNYYNENAQQGYCEIVISPKLAKFRKKFSEFLVE